jgi:hypothetical protein
MEKAKVNFDIDQVKDVFNRNPEINQVIVTSDGNVFLPKAKGYAANHCKTMKVESAIVLRSVIENSPKKESSNPSRTPAIESDPLAWRKLKYGELKAYAESKLGLTTTTLKTKGATALLAEIDALLASAQSAPAQEAPAGGTPAEGISDNTDNHITE